MPDPAAPLDATSIILEGIRSVTSIATIVALPLVGWWVVRSNARRDAAAMARDKEIAETLAAANVSRAKASAEAVELQTAIAQGIATMKTRQDSLVETTKLIHELTNSSLTKQTDLNVALSARNIALEKANSAAETRMDGMEKTISGLEAKVVTARAAGDAPMPVEVVNQPLAVVAKPAPRKRKP